MRLTNFKVSAFSFQSMDNYSEDINSDSWVVLSDILK